MENLEIVFEDLDSPQTIAIKTVGLWVGSNELKPKLEKLGVSYTKIQKGLLTFYCLRSKNWDGIIRVKL